MMYTVRKKTCRYRDMIRLAYQGFDLSTMADGLYDEAIVDIVGPDTIVSEPYAIKVQAFQILKSIQC